MPFDLVIAAQIFGDPAPVLGARRCSVSLCGLEAGLVTMAGGIPIGAPRGIDALDNVETIVVPGLADVEAPVASAALEALRKADARGARIVSICTGACILAAAGLLHGRRAATHWAHADRLAARYPSVLVDPRVLYVDDGRILTSAGMAAGIDLCLHIVRTDWGMDVANVIARAMVVAPHREGGQAQFITRAIPADDTRGLADTRAWALTHLTEALTIPMLATHANISVRHFVRRFRDETGAAPLRWLQAQRVRFAQQLPHATDLSISRLAEQSGLGSAATLRTHFQRVVGTTPLAYRRTFRAGWTERSTPRALERGRASCHTTRNVPFGDDTTRR